MRCVIIYASSHHMNTAKVVDAVAGASSCIEAIPLEDLDPNVLGDCDIIGFATGIFYGKPDSELLRAIESNAETISGKKAFCIVTSGRGLESYATGFCEILRGQGLDVRGGYQCRGYDTFGPFKLVGGISKGHPDDADIAGAIEFVSSIIDG